MERNDLKMSKDVIIVQSHGEADNIANDYTENVMFYIEPDKRLLDRDTVLDYRKHQDEAEKLLTKFMYDKVE